VNKRSQRNKVTLKDIAEKTGFTVTTVSRALKEKDGISETTKELIKKTAKEMNYIDNVLAGALRSGQTKTIAIILGDISNPHFAITVKEMEIVARKRHYNTFIVNTDEDAKIEQQAIYMALSKNVDGIILCPTQNSHENIELLQHNGLPFVLCGRHFADEEHNYVICNDQKGGYLATKHLIDLGHDRILLLNGPTYISSAAERLAGYQQALAEHNIEFSKELVRTVSVKSGQCSKVITRILGEGLQFSAIFAFSDMIANEVIYTLQENGVKVPQDVAVVGFDNIQAKLFFPFPLTTISPTQSIARKAIHLLLKIMKGVGQEKHHHEIIDTSLIVRASTRPEKPL